jgi:RNA recognition motif-containing protein
MSQSELLEEIDSEVSGINFLYLPQSRNRPGNLGYAFVNFVKPEVAVRVLTKFQGRKWANHPLSDKRAVVDYAALQGFRQNIRFYRRSKISKSQHRPYITRA